MLDYKLIEALAMVVREGGFEKAAKTLLITQSAISQRVRNLEDQLGLPLIIRANPPRATAVGSALVAHYTKVTQLERDLESALDLTTATEFLALPIGVNEDSLSLWFMNAITPLVKDRNFTLHITVDDQDETLKLLKAGQVLGCISSIKEPLQGCSSILLGKVVYHCLASDEFMDRWFQGGVTAESVRAAPVVLFTPRDMSHNLFIERVLGLPPTPYPHHFIPSIIGFEAAIKNGLGYGLLPHIQSGRLLSSGDTVEVVPGKTLDIDLYWHHWDLKAGPIRELTGEIVTFARDVLPQK
ncbi:MAG: transcriptional regulator ArgP [Deltaproteobacteria bacterium]|nr:MAG: transcriptional regulator ArgP [Deltaproteobacteria bacterium]